MTNGANGGEGGDGPKRRLLTGRNAYIAGIAAPSLIATGLLVDHFYQAGKYEAAEEKAKAAQKIADSGFGAERENLRTRTLEALRANPSVDALNTAVCDYSNGMKELAEKYNQDFTTEQLQADVSAFGLMARDDSLGIALPLAQKRIDSVDGDFTEYVDKSAKSIALSINPDDTATDKYQAIMQTYREIEGVAGNYSNEGVEVPTFKDFLGKVSFWYDHEAQMRRWARSGDLPTQEAVRQFLDAESTGDRQYVETTEEMRDVFLKAYKDNLRNNVFRQTRELMDETDAARNRSMEAFGGALDAAEKTSTGILTGSGTN